MKFPERIGSWGGSEKILEAVESKEMGMFQVTDALQSLCAAMPSNFVGFPPFYMNLAHITYLTNPLQNLAATATRNDDLPSQYEEEQANKIVRTLL